MKYGRILIILALAAFAWTPAAPAPAAQHRSTRRATGASAKPTPTPADAKATSTTSSPAAAGANKAQNEKTPKTEKTARPTGVAAPDTGSMFAGSNIKLKILQGDDIEIDPNPTTGTTTILGNVYIETDQFTMKCETFRKTGQVTYATGNPVYIEMPGSNGSINKATAKRVTYNLETRRMRFEGDPVVNQIDPDKRTEIKADIIEYTQGATGSGAISLKKINRQPTIKTYYNSESAATPKATPSARKVDSGGGINIPPPDIGG